MYSFYILNYWLSLEQESLREGNKNPGVTDIKYVVVHVPCMPWANNKEQRAGRFFFFPALRDSTIRAPSQQYFILTLTTKT